MTNIPTFDSMRDEEPTFRPPTPLRVRALAKQALRDVAESRSIRQRALEYMFQRPAAAPGADDVRRAADLRVQRLRDAANRAESRLVAAVRATTAALSTHSSQPALRNTSAAASAYLELSLIATDLQYLGQAGDATRYMQTADFYGSTLQEVVAEAGDAKGYFENAFVDAANELDAYRELTAMHNAAQAPRFE